MRIAIGCDHRGLDAKQLITKLITEAEHSYEDFGCYDTGSVDYPDIGYAVAEAVAQGRFGQGILICGTGIGMSMAANKVNGIRAALCHDDFTAGACREHNNANVLCIGARTTEKEVSESIVKKFLTTPFSGAERHVKRVSEIDELGCK